MADIPETSSIPPFSVLSRSVRWIDASIYPCAALMLLMFVWFLPNAHEQPDVTLPMTQPVWSVEPIRPVPNTLAADPAKVALGEMLFNDPRLSGDGISSCRSCHDIGTNGALAGKRHTRTDAPTVFNASLSFRLGWAGDDRSLEEQALHTLEAKMISDGVPLSAIIGRLHDDPRLDRQFVQIYGKHADEAGLIDALASFERSLITPSSPFDRWLAGNRRALNGDQIEGYRLFKTLGCASCHQGRNIGGNLLQKQGIFAPLAARTLTVVRVPSLRNVAATAPYFHDGSAPTLDQAVHRMAKAQLNLELTDREATRLVAFLESLTGEYKGRKVRAAR